MDRTELKNAIKLLNEEEGLLEAANLEKIKVVGKGTKTDELKERFRDTMIALDNANLIGETPEDCVDFFEAHLEEFTKGVVKEVEVDKPEEEVEEAPEAEEDVEIDVDVVEDEDEVEDEVETEVVDTDAFAKLKEKIVLKSKKNLTGFADHLLLEGGDLNEILAKTKKKSESLGLKWGQSLSDIRAFVKHRASRGWKFKVDGDYVELIDYVKP